MMDISRASLLRNNPLNNCSPPKIGTKLSITLIFSWPRAQDRRTCSFRLFYRCESCKTRSSSWNCKKKFFLILKIWFFFLVFLGLRTEVRFLWRWIRLQRNGRQSWLGVRQPARSGRYMLCDDFLNSTRILTLSNEWVCLFVNHKKKKNCLLFIFSSNFDRDRRRRGDEEARKYLVVQASGYSQSWPNRTFFELPTPDGNIPDDVNN